jgi:hypothetical protein
MDVIRINKKANVTQNVVIDYVMWAFAKKAEVYTVKICHDNFKILTETAVLPYILRYEHIQVLCRVYLKFQKQVPHTTAMERIHINKHLQALGFHDAAKKQVDLSLSDFYLWGYFKTIVNSSLIETEKTVHQCILDACLTICNCSSTSERM